MIAVFSNLQQLGLPSALKCDLGTRWCRPLLFVKT